MLASIGILPKMQAANSNTPGSAGLLVVSIRNRSGPWGELREAVRTGRPAFDYVHGMSAFEYFAAHSDDAAIFNDAMTSASAGLTGMLLARL